MAEGYRSYSAVAGRPAPAWLNLAMPSAADLIFVGVLGVLVFTPLSVKLLGDAGIGWHIRAGQQILATHSIPRADSFSSTMVGKPWFAWEWLYDLVAGELESWLGLNGVVWFTAVMIAAVLAGTFRLLVARGTNILVVLLLVLLAMSASMIHFLARPHVVSWLFTLAWFWILQSSEGEPEREPRYGRRARGRRRLWALPLLMLVWVNVHGGFLVGFVLLGIFWLAAVWRWFAANESRIEESLEKIGAGKRAATLLWVSLLSFAASLVNPYGWKLYEHVYGYLSNRFLMSHIDEFQSPNFHGVAQKCFLALLLITVAALWRRGRELRVSDGLAVLFAVYAGLFASRNIPVSSILLVMAVGPLVCVPGFIRGFAERMQAVEVGLRGHIWPLVAVVATLLIAANGGRVGTTQWIDAHFDSGRMPVEAVNFAAQHEIAGPALSPDFWGGYLIYRLYPGTRVVVDDRHDLYGEAFFREYLKMVRGEAGWNDFLREHPAGYLVLPRDAAVTSLLRLTPEWKAIYQDDVAVVFVAAGPNR